MRISNLCWVFTTFLGFLFLCFSHLLIRACIIAPVKSAYLRCYKKSLVHYYAVPLDSADTILHTPYYNSSLRNVIYTFGFTGNPNGLYSTAVLQSLLQLNDRNVFLLDWTKEANSYFGLGNFGLAVSYAIIVVPNSVIVGRNFGKSLIRMSEKGFNLKRTHLIGFSVGAHLFGFTGRYLKRHGKVINRITGLDPAGPMFDRPVVFPALQRDCAEFVDSIHTDPGGYGLNTSLATVDIYVNYENFNNGVNDHHVQPGCPVGSFEIFTTNDRCSHDRSWVLHSESWSGRKTLQAKKIPNCNKWKSGGMSPEVITIGDGMDRRASGVFYMTTNDESPF